jgi:hypothetical protein
VVQGTRRASLKRFDFSSNHSSDHSLAEIVIVVVSQEGTGTQPGATISQLLNQSRVRAYWSALSWLSRCIPTSPMAADPLTDIDFWEFVSCAKCHLPYTSEPGKAIPFWLTECGHIICNNHLSLSLSCSTLNFCATRLQIPTKVVHHAVLLEFWLWLYNKRFSKCSQFFMLVTYSPSAA